jgi:hypothetical protein
LGTLGGNQLTLSTNWTRPSLHFQWRCQKRDKQLGRAVLTRFDKLFTVLRFIGK